MTPHSHTQGDLLPAKGFPCADFSPAQGANCLPRFLPMGAANSPPAAVLARAGVFSPIWHIARSSRRAPGVTPTVQIELPARVVSLLDAPQTAPGVSCANTTQTGGRK